MKRQFLQIPDSEYFNLEAWSNTRLGEVYRELRGTAADYKAPTAAFALGSAVHAAVLEGKEPEARFTKSDLKIITGIRRSVSADIELSGFIRDCQTEVTVLSSWQGVPTKAKIDIYPDSNFVADIKTTRARTDAEFAEMCIKYDYDRAAAWYMKVTGASHFIFFGLSKIAPYPILKFETSTRHKFARRGLCKANFLLTKALEMGIKIKP